jgi:hypothetical protein
MKNAVFWDVAPCRSCELNRRFGGTYRLHQVDLWMTLSSKFSRQLTQEQLRICVTTTRFLLPQYNLCSKRFIAGKKKCTVVGRSKAWNVFALPNPGMLDSNPIRDMAVCLSLFCVVFSSVRNGLPTGWSPVQGVLPTPISLNYRII